MAIKPNPVIIRKHTYPFPAGIQKRMRMTIMFNCISQKG